MDINIINRRKLNKTRWFFIIMGLIEIFVVILITKSIFGLIIGLSTIIPAYLSLNENHIKWNKILGIWGIIKYSPFIWVGLLGFIFGDLHSAKDHGILLKDNLFYSIVVSIEFLFVLLVITSFIFSIILLRLTAKQARLKMG